MVLRWLFLVALTPYSVWLVFAYEYHLLDDVNLPIHEAGHLLFTPFGQTWHMLGGTLLQLAAPLVFVASFLWRGRRFDAAVCGVWAGESLMYTAEYLGDAYVMQLPRVGGELHDWNWLLSKADLVAHCGAIATAVHVVASVVVVASLGAAIAVVVASRSRAAVAA